MSARAWRTWVEKQYEGPPSPEFLEFLSLVFDGFVNPERYPVTCEDFEKAWRAWAWDWLDANDVAMTKRRIEPGRVTDKWMADLGYETTAPSSKNDWQRQHEKGEMTRWVNLSWR